METWPRLKVSSDRLVKSGIEPATPGLQGKRFIHYTTASPTLLLGNILLHLMCVLRCFVKYRLCLMIKGITLLWACVQKVTFLKSVKKIAKTHIIAQITLPFGHLILKLKV